MEVWQTSNLRPLRIGEDVRICYAGRHNKRAYCDSPCDVVSPQYYIDATHSRGHMKPQQESKVLARMNKNNEVLI